MADLSRKMGRIREQLAEAGFAFCPALTPDLQTRDVASELGSIVEIEKELPSKRIPTIQTLRPRQPNEARSNQYSGNYGFGEFPLHSDLAHWARPPRFFALRCIVGSQDVLTRILRWDVIVPSFGHEKLQRAVFSGRNWRSGSSGLVRAATRSETGTILRWDPLFLLPLNSLAQELAVLMREPRWAAGATTVSLKVPGDTLLVDNWRVLHGRSKVLATSQGRKIERVYIEDVTV